MELKEGMYVRTKDGSIDKITDITEEWYQREGDEDEKPYKIYKLNNIYYDDEFDEDTNWFLADFFVKTSYNIIDLIEVGDYVNGYYVSKIWKSGEITHYVDEKPIQRKERQITIQAPSYGGIIHLHNEDIKSIVTKECFESMSYKVGNNNTQ